MQAILPCSSVSPTFRKNISPPFSGSKSKPHFSKRNSLCLPLLAGFLFYLFFGPQEGGYMFLRSVGLFQNALCYNPEEHTVNCPLLGGGLFYYALIN
jgi:hypothetical protein